MLSDVMLNYILTGLSPSLPPYLGNPSFSCPLFSSSLKLLTVCMKTRKMSFVFKPPFFSWCWGRNTQNSLQWPCGISATRRTSGMALWWQWKNGPEKQTNKQTKQNKTSKNNKLAVVHFNVPAQGNFVKAVHMLLFWGVCNIKLLTITLYNYFPEHF